MVMNTLVIDEIMHIFRRSDIADVVASLQLTYGAPDALQFIESVMWSMCVYKTHIIACRQWELVNARDAPDDDTIECLSHDERSRVTASFRRAYGDTHTTCFFEQLRLSKEVLRVHVVACTQLGSHVCSEPPAPGKPLVFDFRDGLPDSQPVRCKFCKKSFKNLDNVRKHCKATHKSEYVACRKRHVADYCEGTEAR